MCRGQRKAKYKPRGVVTLPRTLTDEEIRDYAIRICPKDEYGIMAYEDLEKAFEIVKELNRKLIQ